MTIALTTKLLYNYFKNPYKDLNIQNCKIYKDIFNIGFYGIEINSPVAEAILFDFFGIDTNNILIINIQNKINTLYGLYDGLIRIKGCDEELLDKCLKFNKLDELLNKKYKYKDSNYYKNFIDNNINIGKTYKSNINDNNDLVDENNNIIYKNFIILDDNHCPNCKSSGFITDNNSLSFDNYVPDCKKCFTILCKLCAYIDNKNEPYSKICYNCLDIKSKGNLTTNIKNKINSHKSYDKNRFDIEGDIDYYFITELLKIQDRKCYICKEELLLIDWKPYCCYQFSIDRIKNNEPHNKNNVLISCYYCNCRDYYKFIQDNKICTAKCHNIKKDLRHKSEITEIEIKTLIDNILK